MESILEGPDSLEEEDEEEEDVTGPASSPPALMGLSRTAALFTEQELHCLVSLFFLNRPMAYFYRHSTPSLCAGKLATRRGGSCCWRRCWSYCGHTSIGLLAGSAAFHSFIRLQWPETTATQFQQSYFSW